MRISFFTLLLLLVQLHLLRAQDRLFLSDGSIQEVSILKIMPETISYHFTGETLENTINKADVTKIIFKNGREQIFTDMKGEGISANYEYPPMKENEAAILPFHFVFDGTASKEEGIEAQEYYYNTLMRRPERNTIDYQDPEISQRRLREAGITEPEQYQDYEMSEIERILGVGIIVTGKIIVDYRSTTSNSYGSTTVKVDKKKKKGKVYTSDSTYSRDEFDTKVLFRVYDHGEKIIDVTRRPFLATTRNNYVTALNYLMKRTPFYQKK